jgi:hypothetical protein
MPDASAEEQFERLCGLKGLTWRRIRPARKEGCKRPDYAVWVGGTCCLVEVKQLDPNEEDRKLRRRMEKQEHTTGWEDTPVWKEEKPGRRVRKKITEAASQLRPFANRGIASILVLFDGCLPQPYLRPHKVMKGMYGRDKLEIERVHGSPPSWRASGWRSAGDEGMTRTNNTSVSALAVLGVDRDDDPGIMLYHNEHAAVPLDASCVARVTDYQFNREVRRPAGVDVWVHAITGETLSENMR